MVNIGIRYDGELRCTSTHAPSGEQLYTDAPVDNHGRGESFSPTDLVATALGSCMATIMGIVAANHNIDLRGMTLDVSKEMSADSPRRISRLTTSIHIPLPADHPHRPLLENAARSCPVLHSIHPDIEKNISFFWAD